MQIVRRLVMLSTLLVAGLGFLVAPSLSPAGAAPAQGTSEGETTTTTTPAPIDPNSFVDVIKVSALFDPVMTDFVSNAISDAEHTGSTALVLQADSNGVVISDSQFQDLLDQIARSDVTIALWIGPSSAKLTGQAALLVGVVDEIGMAPGTSVGGISAADVAQFQTTNPERLTVLTDRTLGTTQATDLGVTTQSAPTIGDFIVNLPDVPTREITGENGELRREPLTQVRFGQLSLFAQLAHTVASPAVAYLLLAVGLALMVFELFTAGVGVAGVVGAGSFVLSCYGLAVLPTNWWGIALICASMVAFAIDVQTGIPRFWTATGGVLFILGSFTLYDGLSLSWLTLLAGVVGVLLTFVAGMPAMVRTRFSTPTIGREWMLGEMGRAVTGINPDGVVQIRDAQWRAFTNRATPIDALDKIRVIGIEGLVLEVEPEEGGARDYRDRGAPPARSTKASDGEPESDTDSDTDAVTAENTADVTKGGPDVGSTDVGSDDT